MWFWWDSLSFCPTLREINLCHSPGASPLPLTYGTSLALVPSWWQEEYFGRGLTSPYPQVPFCFVLSVPKAITVKQMTLWVLSILPWKCEMKWKNTPQNYYMGPRLFSIGRGGREKTLKRRWISCSLSSQIELLCIKLCLNEKRLSTQVFYHKVMLLNISDIPILSSRLFDFCLLC